MQLTEFENWLFQELNDFSRRYFQSDNKNSTYVTKSILGIVADFGKSNFNYKVSYTGGNKEGYESGWLYDLVWYTEDDKGNLKTIELALELEQLYGISNIKYDFEKLLIANSKLRVMICLAGKVKIDLIKEYFRNAVMTYESLPKGTRFFVLIWDDWMGDGNFIPYIVIKQ